MEDEDSGEQRVGFGFVQRRPVRIRAKEAAAAEPAPQRAGYLYYLTTPPYPARGSDAAAAGPVVSEGRFYRWPFDAVGIAVDVSALSTIQTFFPVDYLLIGEGQNEDEYYQAVGFHSDITAIVTGQTYYPVDTTISLGEAPGGGPAYEALGLAADITAIITGTTFYPVDYLNEPRQDLAFSADITAITVETP